MGSAQSPIPFVERSREDVDFINSSGEVDEK
jgi:hypothetical protein